MASFKQLAFGELNWFIFYPETLHFHVSRCTHVEASMGTAGVIDDFRYASSTNPAAKEGVTIA